MMKGKKSQFFPTRDDNPRSTTPYVNWIFILTNTIVFTVSLTSLEYFTDAYGFKPAEFGLLTIVTSMFLHGSLGHIFGNMWFLYIFCDNVEDRLGHLAYIIFYLLAGVAATITHYITNIGSQIPAVGASGAISGVLGAYIVFFPNAGVYVAGSFGHIGKVSAKFMIGIWFVFQLISGSFSLFWAQSGIAFFAHIGGFIFGAAFALICRRLKK